MKPSIYLSGVYNITGCYWLGGYRSAETNNFKWVDNSPFSFTNWGQGEPNNQDQIENYIHDTYLISNLKYVGWNDEDWSFHYTVIFELNC